MDDQAATVLRTLAALTPVPDAAADDAAWLAGFRYRTALLRGFGGAPVPLESVSLEMIGAMPVWLYRPARGRLPMLLHVHGGGAIAGSIDGHDPALRLLAARTGWLVAAPAYRLAPEHPFPAQLEDCHTALLALDPARIVVSGDSIGGTIATALAMLARDRGGPAIVGQVLLYPNADLRADATYPSRRSEDGNIIASDDLERQIRLYVRRAEDRSDPLASPLLADCSGLPPAFVATGECDPLRDEGEAYVERLRAAGVATTHRRYPGMIHAFLQMAGAIDATETLLADLSAWLDTVKVSGSGSTP